MTGTSRVHVPPDRLARWLAGFAERHGTPHVTTTEALVTLEAPDGAVATLGLPWGPVTGPEPLAALVVQVTTPRRLGALLVRKSAHAVGVFAGAELVASAVGRSYVQGRTKAGGWSQQRYARRRDQQAGRAYDRAAERAADLLLPEAGRLDALILGGDTAAVRTVLSRTELEPLAALADRFPRRPLPLADPNLQVLRKAREQYLALSIELNDAARLGSAPPQSDHQAGD